MVGEEKPRLVGWTAMTVGLLLLALGALWTLQGLNLVGGSVMSGVQIWSIIGPVVALGGLVLLVLGTRRRNKAKRAELARLANQERQPPQA